VLCRYFFSALGHHQISRFTPTHTPLVPHLAWLDANADKHKEKNTTIEFCVWSTTGSHFVQFRLVAMKPDSAAVCKCNQTYDK